MALAICKCHVDQQEEKKTKLQRGFAVVVFLALPARLCGSCCSSSGTGVIYSSFLLPPLLFAVALLSSAQQRQWLVDRLLPQVGRHTSVARCSGAPVCPLYLSCSLCFCWLHTYIGARGVALTSTRFPPSHTACGCGVQHIMFVPFRGVCSSSCAWCAPPSNATYIQLFVFTRCLLCALVFVPPPPPPHHGTTLSVRCALRGANKSSSRSSSMQLEQRV